MNFDLNRNGRDSRGVDGLMPVWLGWIVGIGVFTCVNFSIGWGVNQLGLPTYIDYAEPVYVSNRYYDEEVFGYQTALGLWMMFVSIVAGVRAGMAIVARDWAGGVGAAGNLQLKVWAVGISVYAGIMTSAWHVFGRELARSPAIIANGLDLLSLMRIY